jgi:hypothetical protein
MNKRHRQAMIAAIAAALTIAVSTSATAAAAKAEAGQLRADMRKLWEDHVTWTRLYIVSVAAGVPDKDLTAQRLLQNQVDIGNAIKPFYGDDAGNKLTALLKEHILGAADLLAAAKAGDQAKVATEKARWYKNADDVAAFLAAANPKNWPLATAKAEMKMHLDLTLKEALDRFGGKYADDIKDYDQVHDHILRFADTLTNGIAAQFPDRVHKS